MTAYFTLTTTSGHQAVIPVLAGQYRWLIAVRYVRAYFPLNNYLANLRPATFEEIATLPAKHPPHELRLAGLRYARRNRAPDGDVLRRTRPVEP